MNKEASKRIGVYVRERRRRVGLTLPELAETSGVTKGGLSKLENGKGNPCLDTLLKIASALRISLAHMIKVSLKELS